MAGTKLRVGCIGAGELATYVHYPSLSEMQDVQIAAVCDLDATRRGKVAEQYGIPAQYADHRVMLDKEKLDAIWCVTQPMHLYPLAADVLRRGVPLFVEKPPGMTAYQTGALAELARQHNTKSMVGFNRRYAPLLVEIRARLEALGPIDHFIYTFSKFGGPDKRPYNDGAIDILISDAIHALDGVRWLGGEPESFTAVNRVSHASQDAKYIALFRFAQGRSGILNCHWNSGHRVLTVEFHSAGAYAFVEIEVEGTLRIGGGKPELLSAEKLAGNPAKHHTGGYFQEDRHFIDCIRAGRDPVNNLADAFRSMTLAEALYTHTL